MPVSYICQSINQNSEVSGVFKVAEGADIRTFTGKRRIEVEGLWFGCKPPTTWMNITVLYTPKFERNYSGKVAWKIKH